MLKKLATFYQKLQSLYVIDALFMLIAIAGVFALRYAYPYGTDLMPQYFFNGERILTTNDGYHYANATRDLLQGYGDKEAFYPSAEFELPAIFSAFLYRIISAFSEISLDSFFYYLPIVLCPLLVIPVFLIAKNLTGNPFVALFAATLAPITQAYSTRTMAGYYDTDMLILTLPLMSAYFLMCVVESNKIRDALLCALFCLLAYEWHRASAVYLLGFCVALGAIYALFAKKPKVLESLSIVIIAFSQIPLLAKLMIIAVILHFISEKVYIFREFTAQIKAKLQFQSLVIFLIALAIGLIANMDTGFSRFLFYVLGDSAGSTIAQVRGTADTIQELQSLGFTKGVERIIGDYYLFALGLIGIAIAFVKVPRSLMLLPFLMLGFASFSLGIRFSMFAAPVLGVGIFYFVHFILQYAPKIFDDKIVIDGVKIATFAVFAYTSIMPHIYFGQNIGYKPALFNDELSALNAIKDDSKSRDNITIAWWDYGFLTSYFTRTRSIISGLDVDGTMHFFVSRIFTNTNEIASHNLIKMASALYYDDSMRGNLMQKFIAKYDIKDPNAFFDNLANISNESLQSAVESLKEREIYLYIPYELFQLTATIKQFSDVDLRDGSATYSDSKLIEYGSVTYAEGENAVYMLDSAMKFDSLNGVLTNNESGKMLPIRAFYTIERVHNLLRTDVVRYDNDSNLNVVFSKELGRFFIMDEATNNSLVVQFFLYENFDRNRFKMIYKSDQSKAWKVL